MFDGERRKMSIAGEIAGAAGLQQQIAKDTPVTVAGLERRNGRLREPRVDGMQGIFD